MPKINFSIEAKIHGALVELALNKQGHLVDVSKMDIYELVSKLDSGELSIDPYTYLYGKNDKEKVVACHFERDRNDPGNKSQKAL